MSHYTGDTDCQAKLSPTSDSTLSTAHTSISGYNSASSASSSAYSSPSNSALSSSAAMVAAAQYSLGDDYANYYRSYPAAYAAMGVGMGVGDPYGLRTKARPSPYSRGSASDYAAYQQAAARLASGYARTAPVAYGFEAR